jgi:L-rhamnose-H+ transport protein
MKYIRGWEWENSWLAFMLVSAGVMPPLLAVVFVPHLHAVYHTVDNRTLLIMALCGLSWGVAQLMLGVAIKLTGMAFAFAVMSGVGCLSGGLLPILLLNPQDLFRPRGLALMGGMPILLLGLILYAKAGRRREIEQKTAVPNSEGHLGAGLIVSVLTGVFGSTFNLGLALAGEVIHRSLAQGATPLTSTYAVWALVFGVGFLPNLVYCTYLLVRRKTLGLYFNSHWLRNSLLAFAMACIWVTAIYIYGTGATLVGKYGTSLGYTVLIAASILSANLFGIFAGEWRGTSHRTTKLLAAAMVAILACVAILNLGGLL